MSTPGGRRPLSEIIPGAPVPPPRPARVRTRTAAELAMDAWEMRCDEYWRQWELRNGWKLDQMGRGEMDPERLAAMRPVR